MGVDIASYRCRIGCFIHSRGGDGIVTIIVDEDGMVHIAGQVWFIAMLLVMYGVERNPGPFDKVLTFRYQFLLIEVGTDILRKVFNHIVGPDFKIFLDNNAAENAQFQRLIAGNKIGLDQQNLLPPIDNSPSSDNFDISLLYCLLRNTCGLRTFKDKVWSNPQPSDTSVEAYITRFKDLRNDLSHSGSVYRDETVLADNWTELCNILKELSNYCGYTNLASSIQTAEAKDIDENLKDRFEKELKVRNEMEKKIDDGFGELIRGQQEIQENIKHRMNQSSQPVSSELPGMKDIENELVSVYEEDFSTLSLCPLLEFERGQMLNLYEIPTMHVIDYHEVDKHQVDKTSVKDKAVKTCYDLFHNADKDCKNIFLTGDAGIGKTSFCKFIALMWCKSKAGIRLENGEMQTFADYLAIFDFVFYVNLRYTYLTDVIAMIVNGLFYCQNDDKWNKMYGIVEQILKNCNSLVIMDGLDEWTPKPEDKRKYELPKRPKSRQCTYFTTCRPYKIENVRLSQANLDHQVKITGLSKKAIYSYVENLTNYTNDKYGKNKKVDDFMRTVKEIGLSNLLHIPLLTSHLFMLWIDRPLTAMSKSSVYGNIMDMLFKLARDRDIVIPPMTFTELKLPEPLSSLNHLKDHFSYVGKLCLISYNLLFKQDTSITSLVFTSDELASEPYCLSETETNFFCSIGILSKNKVMINFGKKEYTLSFLHKSYLEFFAAIYVSSFEANEVLDLFNKCTTTYDVLEFKNFIIFYAGFSTENIALLITKIYSLIGKDLEFVRTWSIFNSCKTYYYEKELRRLRNMVFQSYIEGKCQFDNPVPLEDFIFENASRYGKTERIIEDENKILRKLLVSNGKNVKYLRSDTGVYHNEFDKISNLQVLHICVYDEKVDHVKFNELMTQNKSSLHTFCVTGSNIQWLDLRVLITKHLHNLTSLSLDDLLMAHEDLQEIVKFLSVHILIDYIKLNTVKCIEHEHNKDKCTPFELNTKNHLVFLELSYVNIVCSNIDTKCLENMIFNPLSQSIASCYIDTFNCIQFSLRLIHLSLNGENMLDTRAVGTLISNIQHLSNIKTIDLWYMRIPDNVDLILHPDVKQADTCISLFSVTMSNVWFQSFIERYADKQSRITVSMHYCTIRQNYGDASSELPDDKSVDYMFNYIKQICTVEIRNKGDVLLCFGTTVGQ
ncbi:hypothetical protein ACF0H5_022674 [Mactra antiquata]